MSALENVVNNIIKYRNIREMSQEEFAIALGKKLQFVKNLEAHKYTRAVSLKLLLEASIILQVSPEMLLKQNKGDD